MKHHMIEVEYRKCTNLQVLYEEMSIKFEPG